MLIENLIGVTTEPGAARLLAAGCPTPRPPSSTARWARAYRPGGAARPLRSWTRSWLMFPRCVT